MYTMHAIGVARSPYADVDQIPKGCGAQHQAEGPGDDPDGLGRKPLDPRCIHPSPDNVVLANRVSSGAPDRLGRNPPVNAIVRRADAKLDRRLHTGRVEKKIRRRQDDGNGV